MTKLGCVLTVAASLVLVAVPFDHALAEEGGTSPYLKGSRDFLTGVVPPQPGVYFRDDFVVYNGSIERSLLSGQVQGQLETDLFVNIIRPTIVTSHKVLGATYAYGFSFPQVEANLEGSLITPRGTAAREESLFALGDLIVTPVILGWHNGNWHTNAGLSVWLPTGSYRDGRTLNTGKNYWSLAPQVGVTYLNPATGFDVSVTGIYVTNFENPATNYDSGDVLHIDAAIGTNLTKSLKVGIVGYAMQQVTPDSGAGATLGDFEARSFGIGPAATFTFDVAGTPVSLMAKYYREFGAENTTEGDQGAVSLSFKF